MTSEYNIINTTQFKKIINSLPVGFDVYSFEFNEKQAILRTMNRSHTVYLKLIINPLFFKQYEIAYPNKIVLDILENNIDFNQKPSKYSNNTFEGHGRCDKELTDRKCTIIEMDELIKPIRAYNDTYANVLIKQGGYEAIFDLDIIKQAIFLSRYPEYMLIGLDYEDGNICIKYPLSELIKVEALVASKLIPHTFDNFNVKINANIDRRILP